MQSAAGISLYGHAPTAAVRPKLRGATLIELVMVMVILAIAAGVALPRFANSITRQRLDGAARRIAADLTLARRRAELTSATQRVSFVIAQGTYRLVNFPNPEHPASEYLVRLTDYSVTLTVASFGGGPDLNFSGLGMPDNSGTVTIRAGTQQRSVLVAADGTVTITEPGNPSTISF